MAAATVRGRRKKSWPCTAEQIQAERDIAGHSWRQVAVNLGLGGPQQAREAYTELTGRPHNTSVMTGKRAPRGHTASRKAKAPEWTDDSNQEEIEAQLNGEWIEDIGTPGSKNYVPGHWTGSLVTVRRTIRNYVWEEEVAVSHVTEFTFGKRGDQPLQVWVIDRESGAFRCFRVADITEVR